VKECSKSIARRLGQPGFITHYFAGQGLDIGGKPDPLALYQELFCRMESVRTWDLEDGDAQLMEGVTDATYDFVHSSHCLEHLLDPYMAMRNWLRVVKPGGHLVITVPDEDLYEQGVFPSEFNRDHKWTFTIWKEHSWSERSINLLDLIRSLGQDVEILKVELLAATYRYSLPRYDQTLTPVGECGIEVVLRRRLAAERNIGQPLRDSDTQPSRELRLHLNQYRDDLQRLKQSNTGAPPFENDQAI
jgi:SAM-dependent methyltransferase